MYTSEVLAVVMQQLMEQSPLPMLLMRTVIQSLTMYPRLGGFVMNILSRLILKQVSNRKNAFTRGYYKRDARRNSRARIVIVHGGAAQSEFSAATVARAYSAAYEL